MIPLHTANPTFNLYWFGQHPNFHCNGVHHNGFEEERIIPYGHRACVPTTNASLFVCECGSCTERDAEVALHSFITNTSFDFICPNCQNGIHPPRPDRGGLDRQ